MHETLSSGRARLWVEKARGYLSGVLSSGNKREGVRVFCYHGIVEDYADHRLERNLHLLSTFRSHIGFLRQFRVLSLAELADELSAPQRMRKPAAAITFDDGYANNLVAGEILSSYRLPWSVFVPTGAIGRENSVWTVELSLLLLHGEADRIEVFDKVWLLSDRTTREYAFQMIRYPLKVMPSVQRQLTLETIRGQFPEGETQRLLDKFPSLQMLSWKEVRELGASGVEVGSHGVTHEIHHETQPEAVRRYELSASKEKLEDQLARSCNFFAFPNGNFTASSPDEVRAAGYKLAFTTRPGTVKPGIDPYLLPRLVSVGPVRALTRTFFWEPAN